MKKIYISGQVQKIADNKYRVLASTSAIDRQGDSIDQSGWQIANYLKNPVMLWAHNYDELPVAKATSLDVTPKGLEMDFEFASAEANPKAQQIKLLYDEGFLNAVSVGFIQLERNGNVITRSELLEVSFVPVPANQEALRLAMSKGLEVSLIKEQLEKGEVAQVLDAQEQMELKWANWDEVCEVISALWVVYFDEATPVDHFPTLLTEAISLLSKLTEGSTPVGEGTENAIKDTVVKAVGVVSLTKYSEAIFTKEGRTLSAKTLEKITNAVESMKAASGHLNDLVAASSADKGIVKEVQEVVPPVEEPAAPAPSDATKEDTLEKLSVAVLKGVQGLLRANDKQNEAVLKLVNESVEAFKVSKVG